MHPSYLELGDLMKVRDPLYEPPPPIVDESAKVRCLTVLSDYYFILFFSELFLNNPLTPLLFLKNLKILNKFNNIFLSSNEDRALRGMIQNVVMASFESNCYALSKNTNTNLFASFGTWGLANIILAIQKPRRNI